jgi:hypothetical protein
MSRQIIARNMKAGGANASSTAAIASPPERRVTANAAIAKPSQYSVAVRRNMLPVPGEIGSINHQTVISGDCQSPKYQVWR